MLTAFIKEHFRSPGLAVSTLLISLVALGCGPSASKDSPAPVASALDTAIKRGQEIVAEHLKRENAPFRKVHVRFTIKTAGEPDKIYELDNWRRQTADGSATLSLITKPAEDADLGSLTIEQTGQKAVVVTYAASRGEFRETDTKKMFFGGLTAGELLGEWEKYAFTFVGERDLGGHKVYDIEGKLKPDADSVAARMTASVRADNYVPAELHLFDNTGREVRTYRTVEVKGDAAHPYAAKTEVDNPVYKAAITIEILSCDFPASLDDSLFQREKLKQIVRK